MSAPIAWAWDAEAEVMRPMRRFLERCRRELCDEQRYVLEPVDEAQSARDRAYHAELRDLWSNLPETLSERFTNPTDFRRWLLCECGYCDTSKLAFANAKSAVAALPFLQAGGALVGVTGAIVVVKQAWSQRIRGGMDRETRLKSYSDTLDLARSIIGANRSEAA